MIYGIVPREIKQSFRLKPSLLPCRDVTVACLLPESGYFHLVRLGVLPLVRTPSLRGTQGGYVMEVSCHSTQGQVT